MPVKQKVVIFVERQRVKYSTPWKIGNLFMNRIAINEDDSSEIVKICHLEKTLQDIYYICGSLKSSHYRWLLKQQKFQNNIDEGFKAMFDFGNDDLMPHFIYCSDFTFTDQNLKEIILTSMRKYGIQMALFTFLYMERLHLITKEKSKQVYHGTLPKTDLQNFVWFTYAYDGSVNNDLESFLDDPDFKKKTYSNFCLQKLTKEELKLVEEKNPDYMATFENKFPDVDPEEMKKSDSKDKYLVCFCRRSTEILKL